MSTTVPNLRRVFLAVSFLRWVGPGFIVPVLVLVLTSSGLRLAEVGVVFAVYGATTVLFELPTGGLSDAIGRKPTLVTAGVLFVVFDVGVVMASSLPWFVAVAALGGAGRALSSGPLESWYVDSARAVDPTLVLRKDLSLAGVLSGVALTAGALASVVFTNLPDTLLPGFTNVQLPILGAAVADGVFLAVVLVTLHEPDRSRSTLRQVIADVPSVVRQGVRISSRTPSIRILLGTTFLVAVALVTIEVLWQPRYAEILGGPESAAQVAGFVVAVIAAASVVGSWLAQFLPKGLAHRPGVAACAVLLGGSIGLVGMARSMNPWMLGGLLFVVYVFVSLSGVLRQEMLHEWVPNEQRNTIVSVDSLAGQLGNVGASLLLIPIAGATSIAVGWILGAVAMALSAMLVAFARMPNHFGSLPHTAVGSTNQDPPDSLKYRTEEPYGVEIEPSAGADIDTRSDTP
ncbi:MAG: MFS transporter [Acidimicrobiia bacterium]